jgi:hypothetical protein
MGASKTEPGPFSLQACCDQKGRYSKAQHWREAVPDPTALTGMALIDPANAVALRGDEAGAYFHARASAYRRGWPTRAILVPVEGR